MSATPRSFTNSAMPRRLSVKKEGFTQEDMREIINQLPTFLPSRNSASRRSSRPNTIKIRVDISHELAIYKGFKELDELHQQSPEFVQLLFQSMKQVQENDFMFMTEYFTRLEKKGVNEELMKEMYTRIGNEMLNIAGLSAVQDMIKRLSEKQNSNQWQYGGRKDSPKISFVQALLRLPEALAGAAVVVGLAVAAVGVVAGVLTAVGVLIAGACVVEAPFRFIFSTKPFSQRRAEACVAFKEYVQLPFIKTPNEGNSEVGSVQNDPNYIKSKYHEVDTLPSAREIPVLGGDGEYIQILGRRRKVVREGRYKMITYQGNRICLTEARKIEKQMHSKKN